MMYNVKKMVALGAAAVLLAACSSPDEDGSGGASGPLKIGVLVNTAGALVTSSEQANIGLKFAADQASEKYGREIELVPIEQDGTAQGAVTAATRLIQQEGIKIITGSNTTDQGLALGPVVTRLGGVYVDFTAQGNDLTGKGCQAGYFRVTSNAAAFARLAATVAKGTEVKKWAFIGSDYGFGRDLEAGLQDSLAESGSEITESVFVPLGSADYGSYISQLRDDDATGIIVGLAGSDASTFIKQGLQFEVFDKYESVIGDGFWATLLPEDLPTYAPQMPQAVEIAGLFNDRLDTPEAKEYVEAYKAAHTGSEASLGGSAPVYSAYQSVSIIAQAVADAGTDDVKAVSEALASGTFETPAGEVSMRADDHQLLTKGLVSKPEEIDGSWVLNPVEVIEAGDIEPPLGDCNL
ncbi:ABC transporter substrate-binding protein [Nocardioides sp. 1609]|uniref:ABC transporter substrate-binding protein n=1 Tax=Nocardioides sp. 1609 TaxID=2508327 RepID=UPI00106FECFF|nr:ABC transporter substrate-binding protein [Nocardioides sp. 1609]